MDATESARAGTPEAEPSEPLAAFVESTRTALAELAGVEATVRSMSPTTVNPQPDDISAVVELQSATKGYLVLTVPRSTASALSRSVLAGALDNIDLNLISDCIGEVANVTAGQAKSLLAATPHHFSFGLPNTVIGALPASIVTENCAVEATSFSTSVGELLKSRSK